MLRKSHQFQCSFRLWDLEGKAIINSTATMANTSFLHLQEPLQPSSRILAAIVGIIIVIFGIFGNFLVLAALITSKKLRKLNNLWLTLMTISCIYLLAGVYPLYIFTYIIGYWTFGIRGCMYVSTFNSFCVATIIVQVLFMTLFRYFLIVFPKLYQKVHKKWVVGILVFLIYSVTATLMLNRRMQYFIHGDPSRKEVFFSTKLMSSIMVKYRTNDFSFIIFFTVVLIILLYLYTHIWIVVSRSRKRVAQVISVKSKNGNSFQPKTSRKDIKLIQTLLIMFVMYIVTYIVWPVVFQIGLNRSIPDGAGILSVLLFWAAASLNWVIYGAMNEDFKTAYKRLLRCNCKTTFNTTESTIQTKKSEIG